jgi:hypothetical protein
MFDDLLATFCGTPRPAPVRKPSPVTSQPASPVHSLVARGFEIGKAAAAKVAREQGCYDVATRIEKLELVRKETTSSVVGENH